MATESHESRFPEFAADIRSPEAVRRHFIDAPLEAAQQSVLESAAEVLAVLGMLPDAFAESQKRELRRILKLSNDKDPRVAALQASIEHTAVLQTTARRGQARVKRGLVALTSGRLGFHGFISDSNAAPLAGLTVRLTETKAGAVRTFTATTEADGYFNIDLGMKEWDPHHPRAKASPITMAERIAALFAGRSEPRTAASARSGEPDLFAESMDATAASARSNEASVGEVEILKNGTLLYRDPIPVDLTAGSIYREYVIADAPPSSAPAGGDVPSDRPRPPREPRPPRQPRAEREPSPPEPEVKARDRSVKSREPKRKK